MKDAGKLLGILVVGLGTAVLFYPFLHELGHTAAALLVGAEVAEFRLFPLPSVLCNMRGVGAWGQAFVGAGGLLLPIATICLPHPKHFWFWYIRLLLQGISLLAAFVSAVAAVLYFFGSPVANEDVTQILRALPEARYACLPVLTAMAVFLLGGLRRMHPLLNILRYFHISAVHRPAA